MTSQAIIFDIGGVLEIAPRLDVGGRWERRLGLDAGEIDTRMATSWKAGTIGAMSLEEVLVALEAVIGDHAQAYMEDVWVEYLGTLNVELAEYLRGLRPRYRTAIVSNSFVGAREREQAAYGFEDLVDHIVYSHEAGVAKPDPRIYHLACERLAVRPEEAIFLDDVEAFVEGARGVGMRAVHFRDTAQAIAEIEALLS
ncbi:HAD family hydrolase [Nonomuraea sediminis]|uniref:HAD family hydrolase n=1 Tax=Nonomuraea sediminis TaxID=2835864 RepID=UPI001BDD2C21|nr:HAD family phosphatase [Nonomuraea sediminis]